MGRKTQAGPRARGQPDGLSSMDRQVLSLGRLHFLAAFCPRHRTMSAAWLARIFIPAVNCDCVRFFENDRGQVCAALIWARLTREASERMVVENRPPAAEDWAAGDRLWFLDLLAPFDHGRMVARHIARNPPEGPFYFARLDDRGKVAKVVRGDAAARGGDRVRSFFAGRGWQGVF